MPKLAIIYTALGLIPFVGGAWMVHFGEGGWLGIARFAMPLYAAVILSFLAGGQWGMALASGAGQTGHVIRLSISMLPPVLTWLMLTLPFTSPQNKYLLMALMLVVVAAIDHIYARRGWAPDWYPTLRWPASIIAAASMVVGAQF